MLRVFSHLDVQKWWLTWLLGIQKNTEIYLDSEIGNGTKLYVSSINECQNQN